MSSDFELNNSDFEEGRYSRLRLIPWLGSRPAEKCYDYGCRCRRNRK